MQDYTKKFIEDSDGNVIRINNMPLSTANPMPRADSSDVNLRWLKDDISGKFYPMTSKSFIIGGIGRGSSKEILDFSSYIDFKCDGGIFKLVTMGGHIKYYVLNLALTSGVFAAGDNILTNPLPVAYYPQKDMVFTSNITPDETSKSTTYLSSTDGRIHCFIDPRYEILTEPKFAQIPILTARQVTGVAAYIE